MSENTKTLKQLYFDYKLLNNSEKSLSFVLSKDVYNQPSLIEQTKVFYKLIKRLKKEYNLKFVKLYFSKLPLLLNVFFTVKMLTRILNNRVIAELRILSDEVSITGLDVNKNRRLLNTYSSSFSNISPFIYRGTYNDYLEIMNEDKRIIYRIISDDEFLLLTNMTSKLIVGSVFYDINKDSLFIIDDNLKPIEISSV